MDPRATVFYDQKRTQGDVERSPRRHHKKLGKSLDFLCVSFPKDGVCSQAREPVLLQHAYAHSTGLELSGCSPSRSYGACTAFLFSTASTTHLAPCSPNVSFEGSGHFLYDCFSSTSVQTPDEEFCLRLTLVLTPSKPLCTSSSMCACAGLL